MEFLQSIMDFTIHIDKHLFLFINEYGVWVYGLLFCIIFCETGLVVTPFLPGDSLLFACGVACGSKLLDCQTLLLILLTAGISGDACNYCIGRCVGPLIFEREHRFIKKEYLIRANAFYTMHGGKAILLARFIPILRTFAPFVAGIALMKPKYFFMYNSIGCVLWVGGLVSMGYFLGNIPWVQSHFSLIALCIIFISLLPLCFGILSSKSKR